jgi:hypothetical protein
VRDQRGADHGLSALWPRGELPRVEAIAGGGSIDEAEVVGISSEGV